MLFELKLAIRSLVKSPRFATIVVLTLALGIGSTVAIFSMVNAVLLLPLPYAQPRNLALLYTDFPTFAHDGPGRFPFSRAG
jgi:putative ABC transport system permease protein